jgi:hypothetical protein
VSGPFEDLRHVTIAGAGRRVELPLPAAAPIAELMPVLARLCEADDAGGTPPAWSLARPDAPALDLATSLAAAGVDDGEVLHLVDVSVWRTPSGADLADVLGAAVGLGPRWSGEASAALVAGAAVLAVLAAAGLAVRADTVEDGAGMAALLAAAAALAAAIAVRPGRPASVALAAIGCVLAALGAWGVAGAPHAAAGMVPAALASGVAAGLTAGVRQSWTAASVVAAAAGLALIGLSAVRPGWDLGVATLAARLGPGAWPRHGAPRMARRP